jgi:hypothetical protein
MTSYYVEKLKRSRFYDRKKDLALIQFIAYWAQHFYPMLQNRIGSVSKVFGKPIPEALKVGFFCVAKLRLTRKEVNHLRSVGYPFFAISRFIFRMSFCPPFFHILSSNHNYARFKLLIHRSAHLAIGPAVQVPALLESGAYSFTHLLLYSFPQPVSLRLN